MKKSLEILVIEDKESHLNDVKTMFEARQKAGADLKVTYVSTLEEAYAKMPYVDGIISDVFFPEQPGKEPESQAQKIFDKAVALKKPLVLCTDGYHHGPQLEETFSKLHWSPESKGIYLGMVDYALKSPDKLFTQLHESSVKNWPKAYFTLLDKISPDEAKSFKKYVSDLGIDANELLDGYWGPDHETLSKVIKGKSLWSLKTGSKMTPIKILVGDKILATDPRCKRDFELDYEDIFKDRVELTYIANQQEFIKMAQTKQYDALLIALRWGYEPEEGHRILAEVRDCAPKKVLWSCEEQEEVRKMGYGYGATHCIGLRPAPEEMEKVIFG